MASPLKRAAPFVAARAGRKVAALDIGGAKTACLIGQMGAGPHGFQLLGGGRQRSRGISGGEITDMEALERSIRLAVEDAERQAGEQIQSVVLGIAGARVSSTLIAATTETAGREVSHRDIRRVQAMALSKASQKDRDIIAAYAVAYAVDGQPGVREPSGMIASKLTVHLNVVTAPSSLIANLVECVSRAHLTVDALVPSAVAGGAGTLIEDERDHGAICIDMGASVTTASVYLNGAPAWSGVVRAGGQHVTSDLAQGLGTTFAAAERLKGIYGTADADAPGMREKVECPVLGDDGRLNAVRKAKGELANIIAPRIEETFELVAEQLKASDLGNALPRRAVLTGGASQLSGVRDVAARVLKLPVRLGRPVAADALGEMMNSPCFSTASGLLTYSSAGIVDVAQAGRADSIGDGRFGLWRVNKALSWLRENF